MGNRTTRALARIEAMCWSLADRLTTFDVRVPAEHDVEWPESCATCGGEPAPRLMTLRALKQSAVSAFAGVDPWKRKRVWHVPICEACRVRNQRRAWIGRLIPPIVLVTLLLSGLWIARLLMAASPWLGYPMLAIAVLGSIGVALILGVCIGTPVHAEWDGEDIIIHFQSRHAADAFAVANRLQVTAPQEIAATREDVHHRR